MEKKLIKKLSILGQDLTIEIDNEMDDLGAFTPDVNMLRVRTMNHTVPLPDDKIQLAFWHELIHAILINLGYRDLYHDEEFIERFSGVLLQVLKQIYSE